MWHQSNQKKPDSMTTVAAEKALNKPTASNVTVMVVTYSRIVPKTTPHCGRPLLTSQHMHNIAVM